jgi:hypothetical protein
MKIQKIILEGRKYLGEWDVTMATIVNAYECKDDFGEDIKEYIKRKNIDDLQSIQCNDQIAIMQSDLTEDEKNILKRYLEVMEEAKKKTAGYMENTIFVKLLKKYGE